MPAGTKKSLDVTPIKGGAIPHWTQRKTERSHEENQERAYIAASRRTDRSLEARVQSARMASDIHKKRTGKSFRISEEIVRREEMYEEEDDDYYPRSYHLLGPQALRPASNSSSSDVTSRAEAYLSNRMAMSAMLANSTENWRMNEVNKLFEESFPNAQAQARRQSQSMAAPFSPTSQTSNQAQSPMSPSFQSVNYQQQQQFQQQGNDHSQNQAYLTAQNPNRDVTHSPTNDPSSPTFNTDNYNNSNMDGGFNMSQSAFTTELPAEARMIMEGGVAPNLTMSSMWSQNWNGQETMNQVRTPGGGFYIPQDDEKPVETDMSSQFNLYDNMPEMEWDHVDGEQPMDDEAFAAFIDSSAWNEPMAQ